MQRGVHLARQSEMTKKKVWRYRCDFCKKANCSSASIRKHERRCTANPNRVCGMCQVVGNEQVNLAGLIALCKTANKYNAERILRNLQELTENCPACILAALRQSHNTEYFVNSNYALRFDFKEECERFWKEHPRESGESMKDSFDAICRAIDDFVKS